MATFSVDTLRRGHHEHDATMLAGLYADDATITIVDASSPPSKPTIVQGKDAILGYYEDICSRPMVHEVDDAFVTGDRLAFQVACKYESGERVLTSEMCTLRDGLIAEETLLQAWDG